MKNCKYLERSGEDKEFLEERDEVTIDKKTDRYYKNTPPILFVTDLEDNGILKITRKSMPDFNLWNPWVDHNVKNLGM